MITWLNENQGFIMSVLTLIYVLATILILISNRVMAKAATAANKQQLSLQLLERRLNAYYCLNEWIQIARCLLIEDFRMGTSIDAFYAMLFNNAKDRELESINSELELISFILSRENISEEERRKLVHCQENLVVKRYLKRAAMMSDEYGLIKQIEILFPTIEFEEIKSFCNSFEKAVCELNNESIGQLKFSVKKIIDIEILNKLWQEIKKDFSN